MLIEKLSSTATALLIAASSLLLSSCASTTSQPAYPTECPKPPQPDPRLMEPVSNMLAIPAVDSPDDVVIDYMVQNNQACRQNTERYDELQQWLRGRAQ